MDSQAEFGTLDGCPARFLHHNIRGRSRKFYLFVYYSNIGYDLSSLKIWTLRNKMIIFFGVTRLFFLCMCGVGVGGGYQQTPILFSLRPTNLTRNDRMEYILLQEKKSIWTTSNSSWIKLKHSAQMLLHVVVRYLDQCKNCSGFLKKNEPGAIKGQQALLSRI